MDKIPLRKIDDNPQEPNLLGIFSIRDIDELLAGKDMVQELHRHDFFYILLLEKGAGSHEIDFISYAICNQSVFLMRPGQVHRLTLKAGSTGYLIQFKSDFYYSQDSLALQLLRSTNNPIFCKLEDNRFQKLDSIISLVLTEYNEKQEAYQEVIKSSLSIFFIELLRHRQDKIKLSNENHSYAQEKFEQFLELVERYSIKYKQVSQYAAMLNLSTYQLNTITKKVFHKTPSVLINEHIVLESKRQLLATSNQINQIAYQLGYEDVSYFIRFFKKQTGYSPETFRHNFK